MRLVHKLAIAAIAAVLIAPAAQAQTFVRMVSGPSGGSWYPLGAKIMQVFQEEIKGISTSNQPGGGISNILAVNGGDAQIGWSYGHTTFNGYTGKGKFTKPNPNVMYFATLYPAMFQVAVRKDSPIKSFADMKAPTSVPARRSGRERPLPSRSSRPTGSASTPSRRTAAPSIMLITRNPWR